MTYVIVVLVALLGVSGWGLKHTLEENAVLEKTLDDTEATLESKKEELVNLNEVLAKRENEKEIIYRDKEVVRYKIREVKNNADPSACVNQPVPRSIGCLFNDPPDCEGMSDGSAGTVKRDSDA